MWGPRRSGRAKKHFHPTRYHYYYRYSISNCSEHSVLHLHTAGSNEQKRVSLFDACYFQNTQNVSRALYDIFISCGAAPQRGPGPPHSRGFLDHTQRRTTVIRTSLDKGSARRRDFYLTTRNTHNRQPAMPPVGFEPTISAGERPQTYALDRAATGIGPYNIRRLKFGVGIIFLILAHPVYETWIIQEPNKLELWNKLHFKEKKTESIHHV